MNKDIRENLYQEKYNEFLNKKIDEILKNDNSFIVNNPILEIEYNLDGTKKDIYSLASERDIKNVQFSSDKNELEFKYSQNLISADEYNKRLDEISNIQNEQNLLYDDLIFNIINNNSLSDIKSSIEKYNLNVIDLKRLADAISSVAENKINEFRKNNREFMIDKVSYWNYKYDKISKGLSKSREVESFIISLIEKISKDKGD